MSSDLLPALLGLTGAALLSEGALLPAQAIFCLTNPLLAYTAYRAGSKYSALLFVAYTIFSIRGVLNAL